MFYKANETIFSLDIEGFGGSDASRLQVLSFDGIEAINSEYIFEITLVSKHIRYDITQLLSQNAYLSFTPDKEQGVHGTIIQVKRAAIGKDYASFKVILAPRFYHLNNETDQRAFVDKSVPEIIREVLGQHGQQESIDFEFKLKEDYPKREFCCQYDESTAHFIHRLCEEEGLNIYYEQSQDNHKMVISDDNNFFPSLGRAFGYASDTGFVADHPVFKRFDVNLSSTTTDASYRNYNFTNMKIPEGTAVGVQDKQANNAQEPNLEYYDYPQQHLNKARGDHYSKIQIERLKSYHVKAEGYTDIPELKSGYVFELEDYPPLESLNSEGKWLITQVYHQGRQPQVIEALGGSASAVVKPQHLYKYYRHPIAEELEFPFEELQQGYRNVLISTPKSTAFRPQICHPKKRVLGTQTAIVTGAEGEEIYCDEYGRVKILLHWDRNNPQNENSSHWVRVASNWAHDGYGTVVIPRVGMEVLITFLEGDIDNPVISGAIHNGINKVPYDLPANKTRSVFKTSSSKGGVGSNEFRIEDKAGEEQIFVQAQKDFDQLTKNNHTIEVKNNSHLQVNNEHSETIVKNRYTKNEAEEHHLTELDRKTQIMMNDYKEVTMSEHTTVGTVQTIQAGQEIHIKANAQIVIDGGLSLTLKAGGQHIVLNPAGIWMTMPIWTGGVPMEGAPAVPLMPMTKVKAVEAVTAPIVSLKPYSQNTNNLKFHFKDNHQIPYAHTPYIAYLPDGTTKNGVTDKEGYTSVFYSDEPQNIDIHLLLKNQEEFEQESEAEAEELTHGLQFYLTDEDEIPYANTRYIAHFEGGASIDGITDDKGYTKKLYTSGEQEIKIELLTNDDKLAVGSGKEAATYALQFYLKDEDDIPYANTNYIAYFEDGTSTHGITDDNGNTEVFNTVGEQRINIQLSDVVEGSV